MTQHSTCLRSVGAATVICGRTVLPSIPLPDAEESGALRLYLFGPASAESNDWPLPLQLMAQSIVNKDHVRALGGDRTLAGAFVLHKVVTHSNRQQWIEYVQGELNAIVRASLNHGFGTTAGDGSDCKLALSTSVGECEICSVLTYVLFTRSIAHLVPRVAITFVHMCFAVGPAACRYPMNQLLCVRRSSLPKLSNRRSSLASPAPSVAPALPRPHLP